MSTVRICVIGNSHIGALKLAWSAMAQANAGFDVTFFGSHRGSLADLRSEGRSLVPADDTMREKFLWTSGGHDRVDVDDFDVFFVHGLHSFENVLRAADAAGCLDASAGAAERCRQLPLDETFAAMAGEHVRALLAGLGISAYVSPKPLPSEGILGDADDRAAAWQRCVQKDGALTPAAAALHGRWEALMSAVPHVLQPPATRVRGVFTAESFCEGSVTLTPKMNRKHDATDRKHMNQSYGVQVMDAFLAVARTVTPADRSAVARPAAAVPPVGREQRNHPYARLPECSFWNRTVQGRDGEEITGWYRRKFPLDQARIATAGSCFAQHIGRRLRHSGFHFVDTEPAPAGMPASEQSDNGYGLYSARYGNVYTTRQLLQLFDRAFGEFTPQERYWKKDGGYVDPFRPTIQPQPFATVDELDEARERHLAAVRAMFEKADVFVFTLGLTETWMSKADGAVYPVAPGVSGGEYDAARHEFLNLDSREVIKDLREFFDKARALKAKMKFLLTVSPVPLMATATGGHVVAATTYSKSVLRAAAGEMADRRRYVDYFPSFEIINSHVMGARFYGEDKRSVLERGVDHVMAQFFAEHRPPAARVPAVARADDDDEDEVKCDEALLAAFGKPR